MRDAHLRREGTTLLLGAVLLGLSLFLPRPVNVSPIGAFGLFVGAMARTRHAWIFPLLALALYVVGIGGYHIAVLAGVLLGFSLPALIGRIVLARRRSPLLVILASLAGSAGFFLVSNLGSWAVYGRAQGQTLLEHYLLGLPFFRNTVLGDLGFAVVFFGAYAGLGRFVRSAPPISVRFGG